MFSGTFHSCVATRMFSVRLLRSLVIIFKGSVTWNWDWLNLLSEEWYRKVRAARRGFNVDRCMRENSASVPIFSIQIHLKPFWLPIKMYHHGFSKLLKNAIVEYTPWGFFPLSEWSKKNFTALRMAQPERFGLNAEQNFCTESGKKNFRGTLNGAENFSVPIGELGRGFSKML